MSTIQIIADDRESRSGVIEALRRHNGAEVSVRRLALGDYLLDERLLFERKTLLDFAASLKDGRLFEQGARLAASPLHKAMILEGRAHDLSESGMRREALQGAIISLNLFLGIPLLRSTGAEESARLMLYAARQFDPIARQTPPRLLKGKRPKGKRKTQLRILQSLPGIGPDTAYNLLEAFGNIEAVLTADEQALLGVAGIGAKRAKSIRWAIGEQLASYSTINPPDE
ncbi:MAG: ERCC4 domain-containing protein [Gammaproteobacteria bacterium]